MTTHDKEFAGSIPKFYDTLMVPLIFEDYASDLAELVAASSPGALPPGQCASSSANSQS